MPASTKRKPEPPPEGFIHALLTVLVLLFIHSLGCFILSFSIVPGGPSPLPMAMLRAESRLFPVSSHGNQRKGDPLFPTCSMLYAIAPQPTHQSPPLRVARTTVSLPHTVASSLSIVMCVLVQEGFLACACLLMGSLCHHVWPTADRAHTHTW